MRGRKPDPVPASNIVPGPFPEAAHELSEPDWLMKFNGRKWGENRAKIAADRWHTLAQSLSRKGLLEADNDALVEMAAYAYADWRLAEAHVNRFGVMVKAPKTGVPMHNPYKAIADAAMKRCMAAERELGIPPVERGRAAKAPPRSGRSKRAADKYLNKNG